MGQISSLRDFMVIARAAEGAEKFHARIRQVLDMAALVHPEISWRAQFELGPSEHVEVFSAPDFGAAREVSRMMGALQGVRAELAPLRKGW
jgi:hypothetical protein